MGDILALLMVPHSNSWTFPSLGSLHETRDAESTVDRLHLSNMNTPTRGHAALNVADVALSGRNSQMNLLKSSPWWVNPWHWAEMRTWETNHTPEANLSTICLSTPSKTWLFGLCRCCTQGESNTCHTVVLFWTPVALQLPAAFLELQSKEVLPPAPLKKYEKTSEEEEPLCAVPYSHQATDQFPVWQNIQRGVTCGENESNWAKQAKRNLNSSADK